MTPREPLPVGAASDSAVVRLAPRVRLTIALVGGGLWASGGLWLIFHYFLRSIGPWGPEPHALEPWWLAMHGLFAFLTLSTIGLLGGLHIGKAWASGRRRWTGSILLAWLLVLTITGYLLLYAGDDGAWAIVAPSHWIGGLALPAVYGVHRLIRFLAAVRTPTG